MTALQESPSSTITVRPVAATDVGLGPEHFKGGPIVVGARNVPGGQDLPHSRND